MHKILKNNPLALYLHFSFYAIIFLSLSRIALALWLFDRVETVNGWFPLLLQGLRVDLATLCLLLVVPIIYTLVASNKNPRWTIAKRVIQIWLTLIAVLFVFMELATPSFIQEYNIRPNRLFVEYLVYPKEVYGMLIKSKLPELINLSVLTTATGYFVWKWIPRYIHFRNPVPLKWRPLSILVVVLLVALGGRSTLGHRPLNPSMVYFSNDPGVNSLTLNSFYSVLWSIKQLLSEESSNKMYGELSAQSIIDSARAFKNPDLSAFLSDEIPTYSTQHPSYQGSPKNLVIILEESLGARFVGALGGIGLTPNIDRLSKQGIFYSRMFATGTRSVRGIEAVTTGFTPTTDRSVVKLDKSQHHFFTIAELLKRNDYHTEFIYGGEAHFDNMKGFFLGNGFDHITEEKDYQSAKFIGSWGASDEDLFDKAHSRFEQLSSQHKPFFSLVFSSSNHDPFEYPAGRITPDKGNEKKTRRHNAIKYADWALGQFIDKAKQSDYWDNTVFLIIADHDARSLGADLVPIKSFHIPALILGGGITNRIEPRIVSQIDMPPTLLSLIGIENKSPMIGFDLSKSTDKFEGRALLQNGQNFGYLTEKNITVLQPDKPSIAMKINWNDFSLYSSTAASKEQTLKAKGLALWGKFAYQNELHRLPAPD